MGSKSKVSAGFCLLLTAMLMVLPLSWLVAMLIAACVHELGHYVAIWALTGKHSELVALQALGARMILPEISGWKELVCAIAGPIAGLCLLPLARIMPRVAVCAVLQSSYNLIPIYPRDGGRALRALLQQMISPRRALQVCFWVELICVAIAILSAIYLAFYMHVGVIVFVIVVLDLISTKKSLKTDRFRSTIVTSCE